MAKRRNDTQNELAERDRFYQQQYAQQLATAREKSELEKAQEAETLAWMRATGGSEPMDVTKLAGMGPYLDLARRAKEGEQSDRTPIAAGATWGGQPNTNMMALVGEEKKRQREEEYGGNIYNSFAQLDAQRRGNVFPMLGLQNDRNMGILGSLGNQSSNTMQARVNYRPQPGFWKSLLGGMAQAGAGAAMMAI